MRGMCHIELDLVGSLYLATCETNVIATHNLCNLLASGKMLVVRARWAKWEPGLLVWASNVTGLKTLPRVGGCYFLRHCVGYVPTC